MLLPQGNYITLRGTIVQEPQDEQQRKYTSNDCGYYQSLNFCQCKSQESSRLLIPVCIFLIDNSGWTSFYVLIDNLWFFCELPTFVFHCFLLGYFSFYWFVKLHIKLHIVIFMERCHSDPLQRKDLFPQLFGALLAESHQLLVSSGMAGATEL